MDQRLKASIISLFLFSILAGVAAQPSPPHEVYGNVTDSGSPVPGVNVSAKVSGSVVASDDTDSNGYYSVKVSDDYSGQDFDIYVDGSQEKTYTFSSGSIDNLDVSGDYGLSVSLSDETVDEGNSVSLSPSTANERNPSYTWSFPGGSNGASITGSGSSVTFNAPDNVSSDKDIDVKVQVSNGQGSESESETGTVTVVNTDSGSGDDGSTGGGAGGAGGALPGNNTDSGGNTTDEDSDKQDKQSESPEPVEVDAQVDDETGSASASTNASEGQTVTVNIPEQADENVTQESSGKETATEIESVSPTISSSGTVSVSVSTVSSDEVEEKKDNQISYSNIEVEGEVSKQVIRFSVKKSVLNKRNASPSQVVQERYTDGSWDELETRILEELDDRHRFEAETGGNSIFAVAIEEKQGKLDGDQKDTNQTGEQDTQEESDNTGSLPWILGIVAVLLVGAIYFKEEIIEFSAQYTN